MLVLIYETECFYVRNSVWAPTLLSSVKISVKKLGSALILSIDPLNMKIIQLIDLVLWFWSWISGMKRLTSLRIYFILLDSDNLASSSGIIQTSYIPMQCPSLATLPMQAWLIIVLVTYNIFVFGQNFPFLKNHFPPWTSKRIPI